MDVSELERLSGWYLYNHSKLYSLYSGLLSPIQHNANQGSKQPLEEQLENLLEYLDKMAFDSLSTQQLKKLDDLGISGFIGKDGANFVSSTIRTSEYDPTTASNRISGALEKLNEAHSAFSQYRIALEALGYREKEDPEDDGVVIRVGFQNNAAIENVSDWRDSGRDWYDIIRGLAMAAQESPENTKILGVSNGSIILILAATLSVTTLLALISKNIAAIAKEIVEMRNQVEDLRQKKWLNAAIQKEFSKKEESLRTKALSNIMKDITKTLGILDGEKVNSLEISVKKLLSFNERGGMVDFVSPDGSEEESGGESEDNSALIAAISAIRDYQIVREEVKYLADMSKK